MKKLYGVAGSRGDCLWLGGAFGIMTTDLQEAIKAKDRVIDDSLRVVEFVIKEIGHDKP